MSTFSLSMLTLFVLRFYTCPCLTNANPQTVSPDSLNRLVANAADDSKIIGICGETRLENEDGSWWTMIQVCSEPVHGFRPYSQLYFRFMNTTSRIICQR